jgi:hypothetical protein
MRSSILGLLLLRLVLGLSAASFVVGCGKEDPTFTLLADSQTFTQSVSVDTKVDVLFVIDNSLSMANAQTNLANNFNAFIHSFVTKGYDFHIGVLVSDTWKANFGWGSSYARLKDGSGVAANHSGVFVIDPSTPNLIATFNKNAKEGVGGIGDERPFQSFMIGLQSPLNSDFRRPDAFLAIINVSDEDDFSNDTNNDINENYNDPLLHPISLYTTFLDNLTGSSSTVKRYSFSSIHVLDAACKAVSNVAANIGIRYSALVAATHGVQGSICSPNFSTELDQIQQGILTMASQFYLPREPVESSIHVYVNGVEVPKSSAIGWSYDPTAVSIVFAYSAVPPQGASIRVDYDPVTVK